MKSRVRLVNVKSGREQCGFRRVASVTSLFVYVIGELFALIDFVSCHFNSQIPCETRSYVFFDFFLTRLELVFLRVRIRVFVVVCFSCDKVQPRRPATLASIDSVYWL